MTPNSELSANMVLLYTLKDNYCGEPVREACKHELEQ